MVELSDQEFVDNLRAAVERYLAGVDRWEAAYQRYYRLPGWAERVSADLEAEQREYETQRRTLEEMLPRARRLCLKHPVARSVCRSVTYFTWPPCAAAPCRVSHRAQRAEYRD
jgi:hypothetical protein